MMKKVSIVLALLVGFVFIVLGGAFLWYQESLKPISNDSSSKRLVITKGSTVTQIADKLESEGLIKSAVAFKLYTQINNASNKLFAGEFQLAPNLSVPQLIDKLQAGPSQVWITFPEGLRREEVAVKAAAGLNLEGQAKQNFETEFLLASKNLEGYLYPDTYLFPKEATAGAIVKRLTTTLDSKLDTGTREKISQSGNTLIEVLTMASILERETKNVKSEGPLVAGILWKRMEAGWPIQADATVQYSIGKSGNWWPTPTRADLQTNSSYNTYKIIGLPPTPIASPGIEAIKAAANPVESEYWFYIHDNDGKIHFATTLEEHNQNISKYLQ